MTLLSDLVDWLVKAFGVVRIEDAASYAELDNDLTGLGVKGDDRRQVLETALIIAQAGISTEDLMQTMMTTWQLNGPRTDAAVSTIDRIDTALRGDGRSAMLIVTAQEIINQYREGQET